MAQIAIILPAPTQASQAGAQSGSDDGLFAPHLENATANQHLAENSRSEKKQSAADQAAGDAQAGPRAALGPSQEPDSQGLIPHDVLPLQHGSTPGKTLQNVFDNQGLGQIRQSKPRNSAYQGSALSPSSAVRFAPDNNALLERLRQIINSSSETGTVSINRAAGSLAAAAVVKEAGRPEGAWEASSESDAPQLHSLRQNIHQQYYLARSNTGATGEKNTAADNSSQQGRQNNTQPNDNPAAQAIALSPQNSSAAGGAEPAALSATTGALVHPGASLLSPEISQLTMFPSMTAFHEENIVQQFLERFQLSRKIAETKINIKLHPAELGELKIDLSVKEGAVKANVVAQSQQVQEVIERNISRLRTLLEDRGFTLETLSVTTRSDSVGDFDLFDKQPFSQHDYTRAPSGAGREQRPVFEPDTVYRESFPNAAGVNVRI